MHSLINLQGFVHVAVSEAIQFVRFQQNRSFQNLALGEFFGLPFLNGT